MLSIFSCASRPPVCLLWRNVYLGLLPIFRLGCMSCLYILEIKPLSIASFANIFSHSVGCLFVLFMASFTVPKLVSLIRSHLFIFVFISIALGDWRKKTLIRFILERVWRKGNPPTCWWEYKLVQPLWKTVWRFLKKLKIELLYDPAIPLLGIYPEKTLIQKDTCTPLCS